MGPVYTCMSLKMQMARLAKRLKKEKVNVDIVSFGEEVGCHVHTHMTQDVGKPNKYYCDDS